MTDFLGKERFEPTGEEALRIAEFSLWRLIAGLKPGEVPVFDLSMFESCPCDRTVLFCCMYEDKVYWVHPLILCSLEVLAEEEDYEIIFKDESQADLFFDNAASLNYPHRVTCDRAVLSVLGDSIEKLHEENRSFETMRCHVQEAPLFDDGKTALDFCDEIIESIEPKMAAWVALAYFTKYHPFYEYYGTPSLFGNFNPLLCYLLGVSSMMKKQGITKKEAYESLTWLAECYDFEYVGLKAPDIPEQYKDILLGYLSSLERDDVLNMGQWLRAFDPWDVLLYRLSKRLLREKIEPRDFWFHFKLAEQEGVGLSGHKEVMIWREMGAYFREVGIEEDPSRSWIEDFTRSYEEATGLDPQFLSNSRFCRHMYFVPEGVKGRLLGMV